MMIVAYLYWPVIYLIVYRPFRPFARTRNVCPVAMMGRALLRTHR